MVYVKLLKKYSDHPDHTFEVGAVIATSRDHADRLITDGIAEEDAGEKSNLWQLQNTTR
jgi:hypothetical protein